MKLENNKNITKLIKIYNIENSKLLTLKKNEIENYFESTLSFLY